MGIFCKIKYFELLHLRFTVEISDVFGTRLYKQGF